MGGSACRISPNHSITEFSLLNALLIPDTLPQLSERGAQTRQLVAARLVRHKLQDASVLVLVYFFNSSFTSEK